MATRGKGEGSVRLRADGRWEARISIRGEDGRPKVVSSYHERRPQAIAGIQTLKDQYATTSNRETIRFGELKDQWLRFIRANRSVATYKLYKGTLDLHVSPILIPDHMRLNEITVDRIDRLMRFLEPDTDAEKSGPHYLPNLSAISASRRRTVLQILRRMLNYAKRKKLITVNVADDADMPKAQRKKRTQILSREQGAALLREARSGQFFELFLLALYTAMRQGELFALEFGNFDYKRRTISVEATITETLDGKLARTEPKTEASRRTLHLPRSVAQAIEDLRIRRDAKPIDLIFSDSEGKPLRKSNFLRRIYHPLLRAADLPAVNFHTLRHLGNSILLAQDGNIKAAQERLGHTSSRMTLDVYGHVLPGQQREAAERLDGIFDVE